MADGYEVTNYSSTSAQGTMSPIDCCDKACSCGSGPAQNDDTDSNIGMREVP